MKVKAIKDKMSEHLDDLEVAFEIQFDRIVIKTQDWDFRMERFESEEGGRRYYKLVISPQKIEGKTPWEHFLSMRDHLDDLDAEFNEGA